jgi:hypothetical protein
MFQIETLDPVDKQAEKLHKLLQIYGVSQKATCGAKVRLTLDCRATKFASS